MKRLTLVRHAKSSWHQARLEDSQRPLAERGERDAPLMGARLAARGVLPSLILTSPAVRAETTARLLAGALGYPLDAMQVEPRLYLASPNELLEIVAAQDDVHSDLMLVAHNPGLTELVNRLLPTLGLANVPTCGIAALDWPIEHWREVLDTQPTLAYFDYPKNPELMLAED